jgi:hypothetical protein
VHSQVLDKVRDAAARQSLVYHAYPKDQFGP